MKFSFLDKSKTFWLLQLVGWAGLCVLTYFSLTIWYTTEKFISNVTHILLQAVIGLCLTLILRRVFLKCWDLAIPLRLFLVCSAMLFIAMVWNILRMQLFIWLVVADEYPLKEHPEWVYNKASIFFDFGQEINHKEGNLYYWDNVALGENIEVDYQDLLSPQAHLQSNSYDFANQLPLNFEGETQRTVLTDFGGAFTDITRDPLGKMGNVAVTQKWPNSLYWAGTTMSSGAGFSVPVPLTTEQSKMTVWVFSKVPEVLVRLKLESHDNPEHAMEVEKKVVTQGQWQPVVFDFNNARSGDYEHQVSQIWRDFGGWFYTAVLIVLCWSALYHLIKYAYLLRLEIDKAHDQAKEAEFQSARAMIEAKEAQLQMLRYQLNPHFLFNTLNTVYALIKLKDVDIAKTMVAKLSQFLRNSLDSDPNELVTLAQEIDAIKLYLDIEKVRFEDRLAFSVDVMPQALKCQVPSLILQPLVENSIKYAVSGREDQGIIKLLARVEEDWLQITLQDNGPDNNTQEQTALTSTGIGIKNVKQRLSTLYQNNYEFEIQPLDSGGVAVTIRIPRSDRF